MADGGDALEFASVASIAEIDAAEWNALAAPEGRAVNPFVLHEFLSALEDSGSVGPGTGWQAAHVAMRRGGRLVGAAPLYFKSHSFGEYVFDHQWADAFARVGAPYYPKLVCAPPFSPVVGPRLLVSDEQDRTSLAVALVRFARRGGVSSLHANFLEPEDEVALLACEALPRRGVQYHWFNRGYRDFDDFLDAFLSRKRKQARNERRRASADGVAIERLSGNEATSAHWDALWDFYQDTGARKWGRPYLTRAFFRQIAETLSHRLLLVIASADGKPVAGALSLIGDDALYGRYWGAIQHRPFLHFEVCYYQSIEFAIERGLNRIEAGAQGEHKLARGYEPVVTRSVHWIADKRFREAISIYLVRERAEIDRAMSALAAASPFRRIAS